MAPPQIRHLGPSGLAVVHGTFLFGSGVPADALLDRFYERGGRLVDVALVYGEGEAERLVGDWLRRRAPAGVLLLAKGCHPPHVSPGAVAAEVERTREHLGVEVVDCFVLHRDDEAVGVDEWGDALLEQLAAGAVTTVGVSNWTTARTGQLATYLQGRGSDRLVLLSNHGSLAELVAEPWPGCVAFDADSATLADAGVTRLAWSSLAGGYFAGREARDELVRRAWHGPANEARRARAGQLAAELDTHPSSVALAWLLAEREM